MCTQSSESMIKQETKPSRKSRTKIRKPKYLSLRLQLSPEKTQMPTATGSSDHDRHHQLNLFPLHPENLVEEKDMIALFTAGESAAATTLTGLLEEDTDQSRQSPSSVEYGYGGDGSEEGDRLVRTAMRNGNRERDASEEKWVCYSEVVEMKEEEVMSSGGGGGLCNYGKDKGQNGLSLKLDYEKIMNAWSDKGPLYIQLDSPQTVPNLHDDDFLSSPPNGLSHGWESGNGVWSVPEITVKDEAMGWEDGMNMSIDKRGRREASMLRYKEKRQNRLFAKTIRYQVRKLNAEKRPRVKGRFVKAG